METAHTWINYWAKKKPRKAAIIYNGEAVSYGFFAAAIEATRQYLESKLDATSGGGASPGVVAIAIDSVLDAWVAVLATSALGLDTICVSNVEGILIGKLNDLRCIVVAQNEGKQHGIRDDVRRQQMIVLPTSLYDASALNGDRCLVTQNPGGNLLVSSGTTGRPKMIKISSSQEAIMADTYARHAKLTSASRSFLCDYSLSAFGGYVYGLSSFRLGATIVVDQRPDFVGTFYEASFDYVTLRPAHVDKLFSASQTRAVVAKPRLRLHIGGGFVNFKKIDWLLENVTAEIYHIYGATENSAFAKTRVRCPDDLLWHSIYPNRIVEIVDENDIVVPYEMEGKLRVKNGEHTAHQYVDDPAATAQYFRNGYFYTGDMAVKRSDDRIRILGRISDVLLLKSDKFLVAPIEAKIQEIIDCTNACVFARQRDDTRDEVMVALEMPQPPTADQIKLLSAMFSMAEKVHVASCVAFPQTEGGKTDRSVLRQNLIAESEASAVK